MWIWSQIYVAYFCGIVLLKSGITISDWRLSENLHVAFLIHSHTYLHMHTLIFMYTHCFFCHRITKSQNSWGWAAPLEVILSNPLTQAGHQIPASLSAFLIARPCRVSIACLSRYRSALTNAVIAQKHLMYIRTWSYGARVMKIFRQNNPTLLFRQGESYKKPTGWIYLLY